MERFDGLRLGVHQDLVAPFEGDASEVVGAELHELEVGPRGSVEDEDAFRKCGQVGVAERVEAGEAWNLLRHKG